MPNNENSYEVGYRKPPGHTRFTKGRSGNPKGRPKGSRNLATVLMKVARARIRVTENGCARSMSKFEASMIQLVNQAASGDLKATRELLYWIKVFAESEQNALPLHIPHEKDDAVMARMLERIRQSEDTSAENEIDSAGKDPSREKE